jgi:hypothetical protein
MSVSHLWKLRAEGSPLYSMFISFVGWFFVFIAGVAIPSQPYRDLLVASSFGVAAAADTPPPAVPANATPTTPPATTTPAPAAATPPPRLTGWHLLWMPAVIVVIGLSYTPSNLVLLCSLGAVLGSYAIRSLAEANPSHAQRLPMHVPPLTAMLHGLCVYLGMVGGLIIVQGSVQFDSKDPTMYLRLSAVATLFSVIAGTNRHFIHDVARAFAPFGKKTDEDRPAGGGGGLRLTEGGMREPKREHASTPTSTNGDHVNEPATVGAGAH